MNAGRDSILAAIREAGRTGPARPLHANRPPAPKPARTQGSPAELVSRFIDMALFASATVARLPDVAGIPGEVASYLSRAGLGDEVLLAADPALGALPWRRTPRLMARAGVAGDGTRASVTQAMCGVAETGTLLVAAGPATANALHFLPEAHLCLLHAGTIVGSYEEAWARLRGAFPQAPPRAATFITGPSRTADIEKTPQIGVHGPRRLHILLIDER